MKIWLGVMAASMAFVVLGAIASYGNGTFWPSQVMARWGRAGISYFAHGGMWSDLFVLPPFFLAFVITRYSESWSAKQIAIAVCVGIAFTAGNHLLLITTQVIPDPLGWQKEKWSVPIALHAPYMTLYVALAVLFYFFTPGVSVKAAVLVSTVLGIHMAFGTHIPLGLLNLWYQWDWCPTTFLTNPVIPWMTAGIWIGLAALSWRATNIWAGISVGLIAITLTMVVLYVIQISPSPAKPFYDD